MTTKQWMIQTWRNVWPALALVLLCIVFYWDLLWLPTDHIVAGNDLANMFLPWLRFAGDSLRQGRLPLWNPYLFSGSPFIANPQPALFYPPTWLALAMPTTRALGWMIVLHVWLASAGMVAWLRSEGASPIGALLGSVAFAFGGYFFARVQAGHLGVIATGAWLPFILWAYRRAVTRRSWKLAVLGSLPVGLAILAGHTASFLYVALAFAAYAAFCAWERWRPHAHPPAPLFPSPQGRREAFLPLAWAGTMLLVGALLAAVQLLPTAELVLRSTRQNADYGFAARFSWPPGYLLTLLIPNFFGEPMRTGYWGDGIYDEFIFYVGVLPLLLALLGLRLRHRLAPFLAALGLGALLLAFGEYGILHRLFYRFIPLFQMTRAPARAGFLFTLAAAALAGLTTTALQSAVEEPYARLLRPLKWPVVLAVTVCATMLIVAGFAAFAWGRETNPAAGRLWHLANRTALFLLFFLLAVGLLTVWRHGARRGLAVMAIGLVLLDLWTLGNEVVRVVAVPRSACWQAVAEAVPDPQAFRVLPWGLNDFDQNGALEFGLRSLFGYDPLVLRRYEEFITSRPDPLARTYDLLNAGYLVTTAPQEFLDAARPPRLLAEQSGVYVYERPGALHRAWIVPQVEVIRDGAALLARIHAPDFDPRATALVEAPLECRSTEAPGEIVSLHDQGNRITAQVRGGGGVLIFSEVAYPGWRATVDGAPTPLMRADYLLRALCVPSGEHHVVLVYNPPLLKLGLGVTGVVLWVIIGVAVWPLLSKSRR